MEPSSQRRRGVTIIDVARHAGVSPMTVSRVINRDSGVRDSTRQTVDAAIRALNYTPNLTARSLVTARDVRIGVLYSHPSAAFMSEFLVGAFEEAAARGAQLLLLKGQDGQPPTHEAIENLIDAGVGGMILAPPLGEQAAIRAVIAAARLPMAVVGGVADNAITVRIDDRQAAFDMTRHLIALGHRRLGFVLGNPDQSASAERLRGFEAAVAAADAPGLTTQVVPGDFSYASGLIAGERLLGSALPPSAIFASNDDMAAAIISVAHRRRLDVPGDLSVVGFDDTTAAVTLWPPLTTIRQPVRLLAAEALQLLIRAMRAGSASPDARPAARLLEHAVIERESTAPPSTRTGGSVVPNRR